MKNLMFQPLTFHLKGGKHNLHLDPRTRKQIPRERVTPELEAAKRHSLGTMEDVARPAKPESEIDDNAITRPMVKVVDPCAQKLRAAFDRTAPTKVFCAP